MMDGLVNYVMKKFLLILGNNINNYIYTYIYSYYNKLELNIFT